MSSPRPPVVLLHGVGLDHTMWQPLIAPLAEAGIACTALDLPGHGDQPPLRVPQTLSSLADALVPRLPAGPIHLVGFSLGALIAQHIARFDSPRVRTLTCVSAVCRRTPAEVAAVQARLTAAHADFPASVDESIDRWFPAGVAETDPDIIDATRRTLRANNVESYLHAYTVFAHADAHIAAELGAITTPTLAVTGEHDPGSTPEMSRRIALAVPRGIARTVRGARHMMPVTHPQELADILSAFFTDTEGISP